MTKYLNRQIGQQKDPEAVCVWWILYNKINLYYVFLLKSPSCPRTLQSNMPQTDLSTSLPLPIHIPFPTSQFHTFALWPPCIPLSSSLSFSLSSELSLSLPLPPHGNLAQDKNSISNQQGKETVLEQVAIYLWKKKWNPYIKMNSRWIKYLSLKSQTIKAPKRNIEGFFYNLGMGRTSMRHKIHKP